MLKLILSLLLTLIMCACSERVNKRNSHQEFGNLSPDSLLASDKSMVVSVNQTNSIDTVDVSWFLNKYEKILKRMSPRQQFELYYPAKIPDGSASYEYIEIDEKLKGDTATVTMVHDNQAHIAVQGHKIIMKLVLDKGEWKINSVIQQFKCWKRSKLDPKWSAYPCS